MSAERRFIACTAPGECRGEVHCLEGVELHVIFYAKHCSTGLFIVTITCFGISIRSLFT